MQCWRRILCKGRIKISVKLLENLVSDIIEDDGPGIPEALRVKTEPFLPLRGWGTDWGCRLVRILEAHSEAHDRRFDAPQWGPLTLMPVDGVAQSVVDM